MEFGEDRQGHSGHFSTEDALQRIEARLEAIQQAKFDTFVSSENDDLTSIGMLIENSFQSQTDTANILKALNEIKAKLDTEFSDYESCKRGASLTKMGMLIKNSFQTQGDIFNMERSMKNMQTSMARAEAKLAEIDEMAEQRLIDVDGKLDGLINDDIHVAVMGSLERIEAKLKAEFDDIEVLHDDGQRDFTTLGMLLENTFDTLQAIHEIRAALPNKVAKGA
jgi:hypothetical protein